MKRTLLSAVVLVSLASMTACSSDDNDTPAPAPSSSPSDSTEEPTEAPTEEPTDEPAEAGDDRFQLMTADVQELLAFINTQGDEVNPTSTDEANAAAQLDETTPLIFADYVSDPADESTGSFCLEHAELGTYASFVYADTEATITFGDGACSYEDADATVVGDVATDTWTQGGELMGDLTPQAVVSGS